MNNVVMASISSDVDVQTLSAICVNSCGLQIVMNDLIMSAFVTRNVSNEFLVGMKAYSTIMSNEAEGRKLCYIAEGATKSRSMGNFYI